MKNGPLFFLGLFIALVLSWGVVMEANHQLGSLAPYLDENEGRAYPDRASGLAARGQFVYADLGCAACHTQQVRRPDFGSDQARGWGDRQSFARDYIHQTRVLLGESRVGPDLANLATRKPPYDAEDLLKLLYTGSAQHPAYKFLFHERATGTVQSSQNALKLGSGAVVPAGREIVPTERAQSLVAYLLSLNNSYAYPAETATNTVAPAKEGAHNAAAPAADAAGKSAPAHPAHSK
ncbi:MAG TPA: cbb3-type cytochrome c oxidase subunit II [Opitutaceae bacterium]|nr:cbb3-type cytochrome c oxidase subunit II [Opitutaceae bacterium]